MRLSGWQKLGSVLSILWVAVAAVHTHEMDLRQAQSFADFSYKICSHTRMLANDHDLSRCDAKRAKNIEIWMKGDSGNIAVAALLPIPLGWLAGFILLYFCRIQVAGLRATVPWSDLSRPKRAFAIFCFAALAAGILFMSMLVMNIYVDTRVPVALSPFFDVMKGGDDTVHVSGTWTRLSGGEGSGLAEPLQTSTIECSRAQWRCTEAKASLAGNVLTSEVIDHDIDSWTNDAVVMKDVYPCAEEVFTIDLNTKSVSGAGHRINSDTPFCKMSPFNSTDAEWEYRMESGFPIYWDMRRKARPWPLRVIQSIFGN